MEDITIKERSPLRKLSKKILSLSKKNTISKSDAYEEFTDIVYDDDVEIHDEKKSNIMSSVLPITSKDKTRYLLFLYFCLNPNILKNEFYYIEVQLRIPLYHYLKLWIALAKTF